MLPRSFVATALALAFVPGPVLAAAVMPSVVAGADVRTLAGDGTAGDIDGPAARARFVRPTGLAYDRRSHMLFIADAGGQRIRRLSSDGTVATVAGGGGDEGGYRDGPGASARFNTPSGIAVAPDGTLYVADTGNRCIRKIQDGVVTTLAARFTEPVAVSLASDGTLYVADHGVGIRAISSRGDVSEVPVPAQYAQSVTGLSVWDQGEHMLFITGDFGVVRYNLIYSRLDGVMPASIQERLGAHGVVAISNQLAILSSVRWADIAFFHQQGTWRRIAGDGTQDATQAGGFADGPPAQARFFEPEGLALDDAGNIFVADAGNRRIRLVPAVNPRWIGDFGVAPPPPDPSVYRIVFLSNSFAYTNAVWDDSIEGLIERRLNADRGRVGPAKPVRLEVVYYSASPLGPQADYLEKTLSDGTVDAVIWSLNTQFFITDLTQWSFALPDFSPQNEAGWKATILSAATHLRAAGTQLILVDQPMGTQIGPTESTDFQESISFGESISSGYERFGQLLRQPDYGHGANVALEDFLGSLGLAYLPTYRQFVAYERGSHVPLYAPDDFHFSPAGSAFYADLIVKYLEESRPWNKPAK